MLDVPEEKSRDLLLRCLFGWLATTGMFVAIYTLPYSLSMVLAFTQPVAAAVINYFIGGERLNLLQWFALIFAMVGVIIMTNP